MTLTPTARVLAQLGRDRLNAQRIRERTHVWCPVCGGEGKVEVPSGFAGCTKIMVCAECDGEGVIACDEDDEDSNCAGRFARLAVLEGLEERKS